MRWIAIAILVLAFNAVGQPARGSVAGLLRAVAQKYRDLPSYVVRADSIGHEVGELGAGRTVTIVAFRDATHFSYRARGTVRTDIVADGVSVRFYRPDLGEYLEEPFKSTEGNQHQGASVFATVSARVVYRFRNIDDYIESARWLGSKTIGRKNNVVVERVEVRALQPGETWIDEVWIDARTKLIHKVLRKNIGPPGTSPLLDETSFQYLHINSAIPESYFQLKLPTNARRTKQFRIDRRIHTDWLPVP